MFEGHQRSLSQNIYRQKKLDIYIYLNETSPMLLIYLRHHSTQTLNKSEKHNLQPLPHFLLPNCPNDADKSQNTHRGVSSVSEAA